MGSAKLRSMACQERRAAMFLQWGVRLASGFNFSTSQLLNFTGDAFDVRLPFGGPDCCTVPTVWPMWRERWGASYVSVEGRIGRHRSTLHSGRAHVRRHLRQARHIPDSPSRIALLPAPQRIVSTNACRACRHEDSKRCHICFTPLSRPSV